MRRIHDDPERTNALGLTRYASEFLSAAHHAYVGFGSPGPDGRPAPAPVFFLLGQSVELSLKAFLLHRGVSLRDIRVTYGHGLRQCYRKARELGYGACYSHTSSELVALHHLDDLYESKQLQYIVTGAKRVPRYSEIQRIADGFLHATAREVGFPKHLLPPSVA
jgi:hypothetical protein